MDKKVEKILKKIIFVGILVLTTVTFILVNKSDAIKYLQAKEKIKAEVNKSYNIDKETVDLSELKDNIQNSVNNLKILNPATKNFPVVTVADGYKFKVEKNGNVDDAKEIRIDASSSQNAEIGINVVNEANNGILSNDVNITNTEILSNTIDNNIGSENTLKNEIVEDIAKENYLEYKEDNKTYNGVQTTISKDDAIELNGKANSIIFIKITNGIDMVNNGNINSELAKSEPILADKGKTIEIDIEEIAGTCTTTSQKQQFNLVLKYNDGTIAINCKLKEGMFKQTLTLEKPLSMAYLFTSQNVIFDGYKIKPKIKIM